MSPASVLLSDDALLPDGWTETTIGDIAEVVGGGTPKSTEAENFSSNGQPWITPADLSGFSGMYVSRGRRDLSDRGSKSCSAVLMPKGAVLMSSRAPIGYVAIAANPISTNQGFKSFVLADGAMPEFVYFWLKSNKAELENMGSGSTFAEISGTRAKDIPLILAPLAEQGRIVEKIKELLPFVDAARERLICVPAILKRFRQAVLAAACSGRLTTEWRETQSGTESASVLLERMLPERFNQWKVRHQTRKYQEPEPVLDEELPAIPETWCWTNFDHCSWEITVGHVGPMKDRYVGSGIPFLRSQNVRPLRFDSIGLVQIPPDFHKQLSKSKLEGGEILVVRSGANTGDCCVFPNELGEANCADLVLTRPLSGLCAEYAALYVNSPEGQARLNLRETGIAQPHFNIGAMRVKAFPLPPAQEQQEIVKRVRALFSLTESVERNIAASRHRAEKLTQAILSKAFRGGLVPTEAELARREGRSYEPASELLVRIRAARQHDDTPKQSKRAITKANNGRRPASRR